MKRNENRKMPEPEFESPTGNFPPTRPKSDSVERPSKMLSPKILTNVTKTR
jgi:hypothetical protein